MLRVKSPRDFGAALLFLVIGAAGVYFGKDLQYGTAAQMGPGYFPNLLGWLIMGVGVIVGARAFALEGPAIELPQWRPITFIVAAIFAFGALIDFVGLAGATVAVTLVAAFARPQVKLTETAILALALATFSVGVFIYALNLGLPAWWGN